MLRDDGPVYDFDDKDYPIIFVVENGKFVLRGIGTDSSNHNAIACEREFSTIEELFNSLLRKKK